MTYADFNALIRSLVFRDGEAENLVVSHKNYVLDALIDLQIKVPRLQAGHTDFISPETTLFHCGASIFDCPRGFISGLSAVVLEIRRCCNEAPYKEASKDELDCLLQDNATCVPCCGEVHPYTYYQVNTDGHYIPYPTLEYCWDYPDRSIDSVCAPTSGYFCYWRGQLWMTPHLQSGHFAKLLWNGIKRSFSDTDILDDEVYDREVMLAVEHYLRGKSAASDDCDYTRAIYYDNENPAKPGLYQLKRADLIHTGNRETRLPKRNNCPSC